ncbi:MAG: FUSC family protein [Lachnospiraceae bacterium]|nr:FUSC family protein [Lachnospiraceae bacterium]
MQIKDVNFHVGPRTIKTAAAVVLSMIIVELYGATASKLTFAMLGAMAAVQPTFKDSVESCLTQIIGVLFGAVAGVLLLLLPVHYLVATGIGLVLVITLYNALHIRFSPSLSCFLVVMICTTPGIEPMTYAFGRIWDTAIGLSVGMLINTMIFPYDNSRQIRSTVASLDEELIRFLEDMFDGDDVLPNVEKMSGEIDKMATQLRIFGNQRLILKIKRQRLELKAFQACEGKARQLVAHMEVLCRMERPGRLTQENKDRLGGCAAVIRDERMLDEINEIDVVTNYHVEQILSLRTELLGALRGSSR